MAASTLTDFNQRQRIHVAVRNCARTEIAGAVTLAGRASRGGQRSVDGRQGSRTLALWHSIRGCNVLAGSTLLSRRAADLLVPRPLAVMRDTRPTRARG